MSLRSILPAAVLTAILPASVSSATVAVKYRSASHVYLDRGRLQGLAVGDRLAVVSKGETVAELEVMFLSDHSASCRVVSEKRAVRAGDAVVPMTKAVAEAAPGAASSLALPPPATRPPAAEPRPRPFARARGGLSLGYYRLWDQSSSALDFEQRTARLDLSLWDITGRPYSFSLRARSRQDIRARALSFRNPADQRVDRLYELSLRYEPPSERFAFEAGRIGTSRFVGIGYLDGVLARVQVARPLQLGAFYGQRADLDGLGFQGSGAKYGGFLRLAPGSRYAPGRYEALVALVREFSAREISREYLTLEARVGSGSRWSVFQRAEVDLNRGWRQELTDQAYQVSNVSLSGNLRLSSSVTATASYDGRRNYRYHLNRDVPEVIFDNLLHQGLRGGLYLARPGGLSFSFGAGLRLREGDGRDTYSFNAGIRHARAFGTGLAIGLDVSGFSNTLSEGYLVSAYAGKRFPSGHQIDVGYGRTLYRLKSGTGDRSTEWMRLDGRVAIRHGLYFQTDLEYDRGDDLTGPRLLLELGHRF